MTSPTTINYSNSCRSSKLCVVNWDEYNELVDKVLPLPIINSSRVNIVESGSGDPNIRSGDHMQLKDRVSELGIVQD